MDLVLKPTNLCNFKCSFCSSCDIPSETLSSSKVIDFIKQIGSDLNTIIVNGGDPLMMDPNFYFDIISYLDKNNLKTTISLTTNLWDWYINPTKWDSLFRSPRIGIGTSFQYGEGRYLADGTPFDETIFLKVQEKYKNQFGYYVDFISVITKSNEQFAIKNVELAKTLDVECKLNPVVCSGRQQHMYPRLDIYNLYLSLLKTDLHKWEYNCKNLTNFFNKKTTTCPISNKKCLSSIRCMGPDSKISFCPSLDDNKVYEVEKYRFYKKECLLCQYFNLCNGCFKLVYDLQNEFDGSNCSDLKKVYSEIENIVRSM